MSGDEDVKFSVKVVLTKQKNKVLFAEANSDFVDVLISFLTLPLGAVVRVLKKHYGDKEAPAFGSLTSLYNGLANLDSCHFWTEGCKEVLLNPTGPFAEECRKLKLDISDTQPTEYFTCEHRNCWTTRIGPPWFTSVYYDTAICCCGRPMTRKAVGIITKEFAPAVFTINTASFIISDDLQIFPNSTDLIQTLRNLGITNMDVGELRTVTFGFNEIMDLLMLSLLSRTPLSDFILNRRHVDGLARLKFEPGILYKGKVKEATSNSNEMIILKIMVQKSTNKLLFARAGEDFIDFLCSLLAIPFGAVEYLLVGKTCLKAIDNLYVSIVHLIDDSYLATLDIKNRLMLAKLPHGYISENQILPLIVESFPYTNDTVPRLEKFSSVKFVKGQGKYIRGPTMYKITDDLTVTPFCMASMFLALKEQNIPLSDVLELELEIRLEEGLSILKASHTSASALTDALMTKLMLKKQPKQEL
ncbi:hypothetical protein MIMGU_mgv1a020636mg [Erythranthe guttata]|uniref:DUF674 domain-containing protein n=1 Tax=Erythranthe guttata TaxID=4155 RepID=A0A022R241_ERYGU|nr:PREDICTED: uncharacterized protein LOC105961719 [Erythranthe guttata]EYU34009.1 hypothetical protein MIMGU_mgv1a020636mg [Erythranthe guttata]|eukprot:XP_012841428.1 PREDICTED: uncharacterized protein LOC105961719 [Erythranthe guttata]